MTATVRRLPSDDWRLLRRIRLSAIEDSPGAYVTNFEEEGSLTEDQWRRRLEHSVMFVLETSDEERRAVGLAGLKPMKDDPSTVELISVWIDPVARGQGLGDVLVTTALSEARRLGNTAICLWVAADNGPAGRLYRRHGFEDTGRQQPLRDDDPTRMEIEMRRAVDDA